MNQSFEILFAVKTGYTNVEGEELCVGLVRFWMGQQVATWPVFFKNHFYRMTKDNDLLDLPVEVWALLCDVEKSVIKKLNEVRGHERISAC